MGLISRVSSRTYRNGKMFIKNGETTVHNLPVTITVGELKSAIELAPTARMMSNGQLLNDESAKLEDFGLVCESTIEIVHPVLGGGRKRKKKVYTTPKRLSTSEPRSSSPL